MSRPHRFPPSERPLQRRLHLHIAELGDGEVQVGNGLGPLIGIVVEQQLGQFKAAEAAFLHI